MFAEFTENIDDQGQCDQNEYVGKGNRIGSNRMYSGGHAENKHNIEYIGTDDISEGQTTFTFSGSGDRSDQFWKRSADGNNGQTDKGFTEPKGGGNPTGVIYDQITACLLYTSRCV